MDVLDTEIKRMETYLDNVENSFTNLQDDNFDSCMERIKINMSKFEDTKNELIKNNSRELLRRRSQGLGRKVKQIYQISIIYRLTGMHCARQINSSQPG